jgi:GntR family transcriptional regulator, carbon starvation induced regulator
METIDLPAPTLAETVYRRLRAHIIWGHLPPGEPLRSGTLCPRYGVGISPLREALLRLLSDQLVTLVGQKGFRVAPIDEASVIDTMELRVLVEREALRRSLERGDLNWETAVVGSHHALSRVPAPVGPGPQCESWAGHHRRFHMALISACGSPLQYELAGKLFDQAHRHTIIIVIGMASGEIIAERDRYGEHAEIVEAVLARNSGAACSALEAHHRLSAKYVVQVLRARSEMKQLA